MNFLFVTPTKQPSQKFFSKSLMNILYKEKIMTIPSYHSNKMSLCYIYETFLPTIYCKAFVDFS